MKSVIQNAGPSKCKCVRLGGTYVVTEWHCVARPAPGDFFVDCKQNKRDYWKCATTTGHKYLTLQRQSRRGWARLAGIRFLSTFVIN
jgi:hypothetical protein